MTIERVSARAADIFVKRDTVYLSTSSEPPMSRKRFDSRSRRAEDRDRAMSLQKIRTVTTRQPAGAAVAKGRHDPPRRQVLPRLDGFGGSRRD